jgi:hypothetical protein
MRKTLEYKVATMSKIEGPTYNVEIEWDKEDKPVLYVVAHGQITTPKQAIDAIEVAVGMINAGPHQHVCSVYNMLDVSRLPFLGRFISAGRIPTSPRTAHLILGSENPQIRLIASLIAVTSHSKRLRTLDICFSQDEIDTSVKRWLSLPERTREYNINNV